MKFKKAGPASSPSSSLGIMRFFDTETSGPKMTPEFVTVLVAVLIVALVALHFFA